MVGSRKRVYAPRTQKTAKKAKFTYQKPVISHHNAVSTSKGIGNRVTANFIYFDQFTLDTGLGGVTVFKLFRLNGMFDPDFSVGGHQPGGYDQLMAIYESYCVTEVEYKVIFYNVNTSNAASIVGCQVSDNSSTSGIIGTFIENGNCQHTVVSPTTATPVKTLTGTVDIAKLMGVSRSQLLADDTFWGNSSADPVDQAYLKCFTAPMDVGSDGPLVRCSVELKFKAVLMGGRFVSQS